MVLIESNEIEGKIINRPEYSTNSASESAANANRDVSDGFETASDGELEASDTDDEARHPKQLEAQQRGNKDKEEQQQQHQHERNVTEQEDDDKPIVSPTDDEEQKQVCNFNSILSLTFNNILIYFVVYSTTILLFTQSTKMILQFHLGQVLLIS